MGYYVDLTKISIDEYKSILKNSYLLPSWKILSENIDQNLDSIKVCGLDNLDSLQQTLKTKQKVQNFAAESGISEEYLTILRRVVNGYHPKPVKLSEFPNIPSEAISSFEKIRIKNTFQLYDKILSKNDRAILSQKTAVSDKVILKLSKLTDLCRIRWVNHTFANVLYEAGYDTLEKVVNADYHKLFENIKQLNAERNLYKGNIGLNDMKLVVEIAHDLPQEIQF